jgi:acetolactate synthase-1/3 small subunit
MSEVRRHTMIAMLEDKPGVLNRVTGLFSRRNFNIESLTVGHSEMPGVSRVTFVVRGTTRDINQVRTQLRKLINVLEIVDVTNQPTVTREMALIKVRAEGQSRAEVMQLVDIYRASIVDVCLESVIIQIVGPEDRVNSLIDLLQSFGIEEMVRTGRVTMIRGSELTCNFDPMVAAAMAAVGRNGHK